MPAGRHPVGDPLDGDLPVDGASAPAPRLPVAVREDGIEAVAGIQVLTDDAPPADVEARGAVPVPVLTRVAVGACVAVTVVFGVWPTPLLDFAHQATLLLLR